MIYIDCLRSHFGSRSILFDPTRIRSRIDWRKPPSGWITGSGRGPVGPPLNLERPLVRGSVSTVLSACSSLPFGDVDAWFGAGKLTCHQAS